MLLGIEYGLGSPLTDGADMADAIMVMVFGMGGVFIFLLVLVGLMIGLMRLFPQTAVRLPQVPGPKADADDEIIAVLQAAVSVYEADTQQR